jgi:GT2 family glycosyltransferase
MVRMASEEAGQSPRIAVIIPTHNRREAVVAVLASLDADHYPNKTIFLIDDGSSDGTQEFCRDRFPALQIRRGDGSLWWSGAINLGLEAVREGDFELVLWLNDDNRVEPETLTTMVAAMRQTGPRAIIAARTRSTASGTDEWVGEPPRWHRDYGRWHSPPLEAEVVSLEHPPGGRGVLIPTACFAELGVIDQATFPHYWADHDFHYRAMKAGYRYYLATGAVVWNRPNAPVSSNHEQFSIRGIAHFLFSRRSPMNLPTLRRLLKRHLSPEEYRSIWNPLVRQTLLWLASGWVVRHAFIHRALGRVRRLVLRRGE